MQFFDCQDLTIGNNLPDSSVKKVPPHTKPEK